MRPIPIKERIRAALEAAGGTMLRYELMRAVFPPDVYPKAWNYQANGGPPGCAMPFGRAVREMGCREWGSFRSRMIGLPRQDQN